MPRRCLVSCSNLIALLSNTINRTSHTTRYSLLSLVSIFDVDSDGVISPSELSLAHTLLQSMKLKPPTTSNSEIVQTLKKEEEIAALKKEEEMESAMLQQHDAMRER